MFSHSHLSRRGLELGSVLLLALVRLAPADETNLSSDLSVHGPTIDTRPLNGANKNGAAQNAPISAGDADASANLGSLPLDAAVASTDSAGVPVLASDPSAVSLPGSDPSTDVAVNNIAPRTGSGPKVSALPAAPTTNATINLINLMVRRSLITRDDADGLIREAQQEADNARAQAATVQATAERALTVQQSQPPPAPASAQGGGENSDDETRVVYVPDIVKKQITDQVTQNVMEETREEHLADTIAANQVPEWVKRLHLSGDIRLRFEDDMFPSGNAIGNFTNFNAINTGSAFNVAATNPFLPQYNANQERERFRLRMRIGAGIDLGDNFTAGVRVATGSDDNPTTENQTLGAASGQGGYFAKYQIWLDRAFLRYEYGGTSDADASLSVGRFDNPFFNTSMMWADDLAFDGAVAKASYKVATGVTPFLTVGGFPVFNTDFNFSSNDAEKFTSEDKYLLATQGGVHWTINKDFRFTGAAGFYDFENIQGKISNPIPLDEQDSSGDLVGNTDDSRPSFAQNGNTYIALRNYEGPPPAGTPTPPTYEQQYFGLASQFRVLSLTGQLDYDHFDPFHLSITGEFIKNVAFDRNAIINGGPASEPGPQNNTTNSDPNSFDGGDIGYLIHMDAGKVVLEELWDWNIRLSYRYVQTDATVDAFTDSDFGAPLYGTNLKGFTIGGNLALSKRVWLGLRYMSADNVSGATFHSDLVQFDINAKF